MLGQGAVHRQYAQAKPAWVRLNPDMSIRRVNEFRSFWSVPQGSPESPDAQEAMAMWTASVNRCAASGQFASFLGDNSEELLPDTIFNTSENTECSSTLLFFLGLIWQGLHILGYKNFPYEDVSARRVTRFEISTVVRELHARMLRLVSNEEPEKAFEAPPAVLAILYWMLQSLPSKCRGPFSCPGASSAPAPPLPAQQHAPAAASSSSKHPIGDLLKKKSVSVLAFGTENSPDLLKLEKIYRSSSVGNAVRALPAASVLEPDRRTINENGLKTILSSMKSWPVSTFILACSNEQGSPTWSVNLETGNGLNSLGLLLMHRRKPQDTQLARWLASPDDAEWKRLVEAAIEKVNKLKASVSGHAV